MNRLILGSYFMGLFTACIIFVRGLPTTILIPFVIVWSCFFIGITYSGYKSLQKNKIVK